jgi:hypothetical protein
LYKHLAQVTSRLLKSVQGCRKISFLLQEKNLFGLIKYHSGLKQSALPIGTSKITQMQEGTE